MENLHFYIVLITALIPLLMGYIWYHPSVFGKAWKGEAGMNSEDGKKPNMALVFGLTYLLSCFIGFALSAVVIHQFGFVGMMMNVPGAQDPTTESGQLFKHVLDLYGQNFRTFKHGVFHGTITGIMLVLPIIAINGLFERKSAKYIFINAGFWIVSIALMGGVICAFL